MNQSIADLMTEHGEKVAAVRKRTLELSKMSPEQVAEIEANIKGATEFPTLNAPKYNTVSLEGVVTDEKPSDAYVLRFLAGYKFDAEKAALHLLREQRWRLVDKADEIRDKAKKIGLEGVIPINIRAAAPQSCQLGLSKEGHIISLTRVGFIKPKAMMRSLTADDYVKYCFDSNEIIWDAMQRSCEQNGRLMGVVQVLDLAGLGMKHMDKAFINGYLRKAISWASERYVEYVYRTLIINAPWVFSAIWKMAKGFLNEAQREKVRVCTAGAKSEAELLNYIDRELLPSFMYGERVVPYLEPEHALKTKWEIERPEIRPRLTKFFTDVGAPDRIAEIDDMIAKLEKEDSSTLDKLVEKLEYSYRSTGVKVPPNSRNLARIDLDAMIAEMSAKAEGETKSE